MYFFKILKEYKFKLIFFIINMVNKKYNHDYENKLLDHANELIELEKNYLNFSKEYDDKVNKLLQTELSKFKDFTGVHYNYLEQLYFNKKFENLNISSLVATHYCFWLF